jgi:hypothetical protein
MDGALGSCHFLGVSFVFNNVETIIEFTRRLSERFALATGPAKCITVQASSHFAILSFLSTDILTTGCNMPIFSAATFCLTHKSKHSYTPTSKMMFAKSKGCVHNHQSETFEKHSLLPNLCVGLEF